MISLLKKIFLIKKMYLYIYKKLFCLTIFIFNIITNLIVIFNSHFEYYMKKLQVFNYDQNLNFKVFF